MFWSEEIFRIFHYDPTAKPSLDLVLQRVHPEDLPLVQEAIAHAVSGIQDLNFEHRLLMPDGTVKHVHAVGRALKDASGSVELVGAVTDVTAPKRAEAELYKVQADLAHVTRVTTLGELTASIAHEVNQPLAAIVTNGEVSLRLLNHEQPDVAELREAISAMIGDGKRASEIIQRLRALSRKSEAVKSDLDINVIIQEIIPLVRGMAAGHRVSAIPTGRYSTRPTPFRWNRSAGR
jgi:signal transduction histidine kinase